MNLDILDRITVLLDGKDQKELTEYLGLKNVAFSEWKSGKSKSYRKYLIEIAKFFNVSIDYLVYGKERTGTVSDDVRELLSYYSNLSDIDRGKLLGKAEALVELATERATKERAAEQEKKTAKPVEFAADERITPDEPELYMIKYYDYPASAGTGLFLDETTAEKITIVKTPEALRADFAIPIKGDSMEPDFSDGDVVLVESCPCVSRGEIGIFLLDGEAFFKEFGGDCLISYNKKKYDPIMLKDYTSSVCLGRVLGKAEIIK